MKKLLQAVGFALCFANVAVAAPIKATKLEEIAYTQKDIQKICRLFKTGCNESFGGQFGLYQDNKQAVYFIDGTRITLLEGKPYRIKQVWDLKNYQASQKVKEGYWQHIYPVFYPLNASEKAIAFVGECDNSSSADCTTWADFLLLHPNGEYSAALKGVLFSGRTYQYVCEVDEKANNPHCSDTTNTTLSIQYKDDGKFYYLWGLNHTTIAWKAGVSDKLKTKETTPVKWVRPFEAE